MPHAFSYGFNFGGGAETGLGWHIEATWIRLSMVPQHSETICVTGDGDEVDFVSAYHLPLHYPTSRHNGGSNVLWLDGHVDWHEFDELIGNGSWWTRAAD